MPAYNPASPSIRTVMADAGYESRKLARELKRRHGWRLHITKRRQRAFKVAFIDLAAIRLMLKRLAPR